MDWYPLLNSLRIAAISAVVVFFAGIAAAYYIAKLPRLVKGVLDVILTLPLVLPPTVVGYLILRILGPKRLIGAWVLETFGIRLVPHPGPHRGRGQGRRHAEAAGDLRHPTGDDVVVGYLRHGHRGVSPDIPHGAGRFRVL